MSKPFAYRLTFYSIGLLVLAMGISLNTKSCLGVSPLISVAYSISEIFSLNFGNMTLLWYSLFVFVELCLHLWQNRAAANRQRLKLLLVADLLQIPLSIVFTRFLNLFDHLIPTLTNAEFSTRLTMLIAAIICTGVGAAMSLNMRLIPNPGDGIVQALADVSGKSVGFTKNGFDLTCLLLTIAISFALSGHLIGVGIGTLLAMIGVGRTIAVFNRFAQAPMLQLATLKN
ncbi:MAG: DUF6198 family protein [Peptococcaceae bacterium]|nr:DUF6198 family protein [Peptococcaceae bacterium]